MIVSGLNNNWGASMATVREYRLEAGLSKNDLCKKADVDYATLTRAENGEPIFEYNAAKIAKALSSALGRTITLKDIDGLTVYQP